MKHFKFCIKLTGVVGVEKGGFGTLGQGFEMPLSRDLGWEGGIPRLSPGVRVLLLQFQLRAPPTSFSASSSSFPKFSLVPL